MITLSEARDALKLAAEIALYYRSLMAASEGLNLPCLIDDVTAKSHLSRINKFYLRSGRDPVFFYDDFPSLDNEKVEWILSEVVDIVRIRFQTEIAILEAGS